VYTLAGFVPSLSSTFQVRNYTPLNMDGDNFSFREPSTVLEARAVMESIRVEKGYLDDVTQRDLNTLLPRSRLKIQRIIEAKRETEAAYTKRYS
jgi:hypothetical protein